MEEKMCGLNPYLDTLTLGITKIMESSPGVTEVNFTEKPATERHKIISWEQKNLCTLPEDLRNFYLMTDGFLMTWNVKFDGNPMQLGSLVINSISKLSRLGESAVYTLPNAPNLADLEDSDDEATESQRAKPSFDSHHLIFELDPCNGNGKVCLVFRNVKKGVLSVDAEIWFLDRALYWHFLAETFTAYYRLLITHRGLPQWQYAFTSYGVSPQAKQWFNMYKPITFNPSFLSEDKEAYINKLDPNKVFRSKSKTPVTKKKLPAQPAASPKSQGSVGAAKTASPSNTGKK